MKSGPLFRLRAKAPSAVRPSSLGVHHATVIRHIDALEQRLGVKLFQRHARGYTATEAGQDLLQVAQATDDQFTQLAGRIKGQGEGVSGDLVVTSLGMASRILTPILVAVSGRASRSPRAVSDRRTCVSAGVWRGACGHPCR